MKTVIEVTGQVTLSYDENSKEFKEAFDSYREVIYRNGTIDDMLNHVAFHVIRFGVDTMVEGVGIVGNGKPAANQPDSGIIVNPGFDDFEFNTIASTR